MHSYKEWGGLVGGIVGFGAPLGILVLRGLLPEGAAQFLATVQNEIIHHPVFYSGLFLLVPLLFGVAGFQMGLGRDKLHEQTVVLRNQSRTDDLTGHYNHRHLMIEMEKEIERAHRYKHTLSGMMLDVDDFKKINDKHGHLAGDEVLRQIADVVDQSVRKIDILGRYGGDEFFVILPESDKQAAYVVAERIQKNVRDYRARLDRGS